MISSLIRAFNYFIDKWILFNVSTAVYSSLSISVSSNPSGITFSSDGTKMFIINGATVSQYTLSTAWNVSTATYASLSKSVSAQDTDPYTLAFSSDGTKMFISGNATNTVYQYTLSTAWNVSTATYASQKSVSAQNANPYGLAFSPDGTKMFISGGAAGTVFQYTLSTAWDVSTATYASQKSVNTQETTPTGLAFSPDGTKMFILGTADIVYQYTLSTAWNVSTATYASLSKSVGEQDANTYGLAFSPDGTKMFIAGIGTDKVYQYTT